jgi:class 3 adenylate cyclase
MPRHDQLIAQIRTIATTAVHIQRGRIVPRAEDVALVDGARQFQATFAYADLVGSSLLATRFPTPDVAKIYKAFLGAATTTFRSYQGQIRSFDGDRVLAVFLGDDAELRAVRAGLQLNGVMVEIVRPAMHKALAFLREGGFALRHRTGIDSGTVTAVRVGPMANNDLSWIGAPPNVAAKLAASPPQFGATVVTAHVYGRLPDELRWNAGNPLWTPRDWEGPEGRTQIYGSTASLPVDASPFIRTGFARWLER